MEAIRGKHSFALDAAALAARVADYQSLLLDLGTGDGRYVARVARANPAYFALGLDSCRENLRDSSRRAPPNALFAIANALALPSTLDGLASWVTLNFPWGSLLRGLLHGDPALLAGLQRVTRAGATLEIRLNGGALGELGHNLETGETRIRQVLRAAGFGIQGYRALDAAALRACPTTWARRLAAGRDPRGLYLRAVAPTRVAEGIYSTTGAGQGWARPPPGKTPPPFPGVRTCAILRPSGGGEVAGSDRNEATTMATHSRSWRGRALGRWHRQLDGGANRVALVSLAGAAAGAAFAAYAGTIEVTSGTILLFQREQWLFWLLGVLLSGATGLLAARFAAPRERRAPAPAVALGQATTLPTTALLPGVATFGVVLLISVYHNQAMIGVAPALLAPTLAIALIAHDHLDDEAGTVRRAARTTHVLLTHGVAFLTLATIYINKVRSLLSASTVALVACLLLVQIADGERFPAERRLIYGLVGGVILGEVTWALNYWPLTGWTGGALLLIAFYLVAGLILAQIRTGLHRRELLEYGLVSAVAFGIVAWSLW